MIRGLQVKARAKATSHLWHHLNFLNGHQIWRLYRWFGFDTHRVFCSCGIEFTEPRPGDEDISALLDKLEWYKAARAEEQRLRHGARGS